MANWYSEIIIAVISGVVILGQHALNRRTLTAQAHRIEVQAEKTKAEAYQLRSDADEKQSRVALNIMDLFSGQMAEMVQSVVALSKTVNEKDSRLDRMEEKIAEKDRDIVLLRSQINEVRDSDAKKAARISALESQVDQLTRDGHAKDELISRLRQEITDLTAARLIDQRRITELETELEAERTLKKQLAETSSFSLMLHGQDSVEVVQQP